MRGGNTMTTQDRADQLEAKMATIDKQVDATRIASQEMLARLEKMFNAGVITGREALRRGRLARENFAKAFADAISQYGALAPELESLKLAALADVYAEAIRDYEAGER